MEHQVKKQILVIGAGLAGLVSALRLQRSGYTVVLIDRRPKVGGLCGTFDIDGHEFVIACNDFGSGLAKLLSELEVDVKFEHKKSIVFYRDNWFNATPDLATLWKLRGQWKNVITLLGGVIAQQLPWRSTMSIEDFANRHATSGVVNDMAKLIAYFMGVKPSEIKTAYFGLDSKFNYGYTKMACPIGGPQVLTDAIANAFIGKGGKIFLNSNYQGYRKHNDFFYTKLFQQDLKVIEHNCVIEIQSKCIIDTREQAGLYPSNVKRGLPLTVLCLAVNETFVYPPKTHTITYFEPDISDWFGKLDKGEQSLRFGFHVFKSDIKNSTTHTYPLNVYFYLPRGITQLEFDERQTYSDYIFICLEKLLPGIAKHIVYSRLFTPDDFVATHGLSSRVMPFITTNAKPFNYSQEANYFYAGHSVYPPGDHAGAAALSGDLVAKAIIANEPGFPSINKTGVAHENMHQQA